MLIAILDQFNRQNLPLYCWKGGDVKCTMNGSYRFKISSISTAARTRSIAAFDTIWKLKSVNTSWR